MNNEQLIAAAAIEYGLYTEEQVDEILECRGSLPLHSFSIWKTLGFVPKKGSRGYETYLWKKKTKKKTEEKEQITEENKNDFIKVKTFLFDISQCEPLNVSDSEKNA